MYLPPQFAAKDPTIALELIRAYPFASLISTDDEGLPFVTPLPLHLVEEDEAGGGGLTLLGHVARPNPHAGYLRQRATALAVFQGPQAYMTPRVYPDLTRVPTWSYLAVHAKVQATFIESFDDKDRLLKHLIHDHDPAYDPQWRALPEDYQHKMMGGIHAFELRVVDLQCKVKLNQHRPESHAAMVAAYEAGNDNERALAGWMRRLGLTGQGA
ncbi:FMN-binding negative transcriptional regulator [Hydrogenophaga sp. PBL-H3]|uniref:FMN-binding negative transcriptional regulator n=1 Tax=Hydrogenophaga sp. PBL-H3 TaxID=434010 RepID=UPI00131FE416|nr:FMN-binding negative transcriptional regulator [Hydrogenophaga sp. PBL-H3]QHE76561.1 FMN-binding negative transcriptional regulator [Hydrogenophaga sp. PBL-H3]QHE80985.1 FMN-binding negative transcriptional regulator [Hydrogenophaga sp. PBL-H3]